MCMLNCIATATISGFGIGYGWLESLSQPLNVSITITVLSQAFSHALLMIVTVSVCFDIKGVSNKLTLTSKAKTCISSVMFNTKLKSGYQKRVFIPLQVQMKT